MDDTHPVLVQSHRKMVASSSNEPCAASTCPAARSRRHYAARFLSRPLLCVVLVILSINASSAQQVSHSTRWFLPLPSMRSCVQTTQKSGSSRGYVAPSPSSPTPLAPFFRALYTTWSYTMGSCPGACLVAPCMATGKPQSCSRLDPPTHSIS